ncbi:SAM-dependent methyltransferase [Methanosphaerula palustris]|nr:SAM-dependent methyltransferase [Methanosphaerula palustris]
MFGPWDREPRRSVAWNQNLPGPPPPTVLDVGCGTDAMGLLFAEMGVRVTGVFAGPLAVIMREIRAGFPMIGGTDGSAGHHQG